MPTPHDAMVSAQAISPGPGGRTHSTGAAPLADTPADIEF